VGLRLDAQDEFTRSLIVISEFAGTLVGFDDYVSK
jgi:hypothetical protein